MVDPALSLIVYWSLALLLGAAAAHKLSNWHDFRAVLASYRLLGAPLVTTASVTLIVVEAGIAAGLVLRVPGAAAAAAGLLALYAAAMAVNLLRDRRLMDCGCGGRRQPLSWALVARNILLTGMVLVPLAPEGERVLGWLDYVTAVGGVMVLSLLYLAADTLLAAWEPPPEEWV